MQVCYPTTPAQYFHLLRRQVRAEPARPLVVMTPKSLLRLTAATSAAAELTAGGGRRLADGGDCPPRPAPRRRRAGGGRLPARLGRRRDQGSRGRPPRRALRGQGLLR